MNASLKFGLIALACLVVGVPIWVGVFAPNRASLSIFTEVGFWLSIGIGMGFLLLGFWLGKRANVG